MAPTKRKLFGSLSMKKRVCPVLGRVLTDVLVRLGERRADHHLAPPVTGRLGETALQLIDVIALGRLRSQICTVLVCLPVTRRLGKDAVVEQLGAVELADVAQCRREVELEMRL